MIYIDGHFTFFLSSLLFFNLFIKPQFSSAQSLSHTWLCNPMNYSTPCFPLHHKLLELAQTHVHPAISSSVIPSTSCIQFFPASGSFPISQFFASGDQSTGVSASASVLPLTIQDWFPLGLTGLISLQSKGLSRVISSTVVQKHQCSVSYCKKRN